MAQSFNISCNNYIFLAFVTFTINGLILLFAGLILSYIIDFNYPTGNVILKLHFFLTLMCGLALLGADILLLYKLQSKRIALVVGALVILMMFLLVAALTLMFMLVPFRTDLSKETNPARWNYTQMTFKCCGIRGAEDWVGANADRAELPASCCPAGFDDTASSKCTKHVAYKSGCLEVLRDMDWIFEALRTIFFLCTLLHFSFTVTIISFKRRKRAPIA